MPELNYWLELLFTNTKLDLSLASQLIPPAH